MSQANVELVRGSFGESGGTGQGVLRILDPEIEWHTRADLPDSGVHRGHEGVAALFQGWLGSFDDFIDRGDYVVVSMVLRGRIRGSEQEVAMPESWVFRLRDGLAVEVHEYQTLDEALESVGLAG